MRISCALLVALAACGGSNKAPAELSAKEHLREAERHEAVAAEHIQRSVPEANSTQGVVTCIDNPLVPEPNSGTEDIPVMKPCFATDTSEAHLAAARQNLQEAAEHRARAAG